MIGLYTYIYIYMAVFRAEKGWTLLTRFYHFARWYRWCSLHQREADEPTSANTWPPGVPVHILWYVPSH